MDELMMHLFSLIANQVRNRQELFEDEGRIMQKLVNGGYHFHEADAALTLMQALVRKQDETFFGADRSAGMRAMNSEERSRFTVDAFSFAVKLGHLGVISEEQREELIEKAMNIYTGQIGLDNVKALVAFLLFSNSVERGEGSAFSSGPKKKGSWN